MSISSNVMAKRFLRDQIGIMKKYGKTPKLSANKTKKLLTKIQDSFESLRNASPAENHKNS